MIRGIRRFHGQASRLLVAVTAFALLLQSIFLAFSISPSLPLHRDDRAWLLSIDPHAFCGDQENGSERGKDRHKGECCDISCVMHMWIFNDPSLRIVAAGRLMPIRLRIEGASAPRRNICHQWPWSRGPPSLFSHCEI